MAKKPTHLALIAVASLRGGIIYPKEVAGLLILEEDLNSVENFIRQFKSCNNGQPDAVVASKVAIAADEILNLKR